MTEESKVVSKRARYSSLGLLDNPFWLADETLEYAIESATAFEANRLLNVILSSAGEEAPKPILVSKSDVPSYYPLRAIAHVEKAIITGESPEILHAYISMFMLHTGRIRSTLAILGERVAFRSFDKTLAAYLDTVFAEPDEALIAYQMLGAEGFEEFKARYHDDRIAAIEEIFGPLYIERRPELATVNDLRQTRLEVDVEEVEDIPEIDSTIEDAPGMEIIMAEEADELAAEENRGAVLDYIIEYTKVHLSPVIARALRVYKERGLAAMSTEFRVTKAPRKTLGALVKFARYRYQKIVIIYDGFETWDGVPTDMRSQIAASFNEIRWLVDGDAFIVMILERGKVRELEEMFGGGEQIDWEFDDVNAIFKDRDALHEDMMNRWLAGAAVADTKPMTVADPVLVQLLEASDGSLRLFLMKAHTAIENAADRSASSLDDEALAAGLAAELPEVVL